MPLPPEQQPEADALLQLAHTLGLHKPEHVESFLGQYTKVRSGVVSDTVVMFANRMTHQLHLLRMWRDEDNIVIANTRPGLEEEDEARLVERIVEEEISDPSRIAAMILELQSLRAVLH